MFTFTDSELAEVRTILSRRALDLHLDELSLLERNLPLDSIYEELAEIRSLLSKFSK